MSKFNIMSAESAAAIVKNGDKVGLGGFTASGTPKAVMNAVAKMAEEEHAANRPFQISLITGASTGDSVDGALARAKAVKFRTPYQSNGDTRANINANATSYVDAHLSHLAQFITYRQEELDVVVIEASDLSDSGEIVPTCGIGIAPTLCARAKKIIVELNRFHPAALHGMHDIYIPLAPPHRLPIPLVKPDDRIGSPVIKVDPNKIVAVVEVNLPNEGGKFTPIDDTTAKIGQHVANFIVAEMRAKRIPAEFLPIQSGVGNIANAVLSALGDNQEIPAFNVFTEVIQDSVIALMKKERVKFASGGSLSVSNETLDEVYSNLNFFKDKILMRPVEITNNPELVRRLGLITINTALEADIFGNVNSTHVLGTKMMNGIGGSADFARNAYLPIFTCPSVAKGGAISAIVPMVSHLDHSEHSTQILITEQGIADLRGKAPIERAHEIIENCAHPDYRPLLRQYLTLGKGHTPHNLNTCFAFHTTFAQQADMRKTDFSSFVK